MGFAEADISRLLASSLIDRIDYHPTIGSTNDRAREIAGAVPYKQVVLILADEQTAGRGRGTNRWWTGEGSLAFSLLLDPGAHGIERRHYAMIALAAAVAIVDTASPLLPDVTVGLHWPNDVFVGERKLAGILVEALPDGRHIVGIGANVNNSLAAAPPELSSIVTTLSDVAGQHFDRCELLLRLLANLRLTLDQLANSPAALGLRSHHLCLQRGRTLTVQWADRQTTGVCQGIADDGALLLDTPGGPQTIYSGVIVKA